MISRLFLFTFLFGWALLTACGSQQAVAPPAEPTSAPTEPVEPPTATSAPAEPAEPPTATSAPTQPPTATSAPTEPPEPATATSAPTQPPTPTAANLYQGLPQGFTDDGTPVLGFADAPLLFIDYSDFLCPTCRRYIEEVEPVILDTYASSSQLRLAFRPVLNHGERSLRTSEAALCAAWQDQFWPMHDLLFARQDELWAVAEADLPALMIRYATELGLDQATFESCLAEGAALAQVQAWDAEQRQRGITAQPTFELGDRRLVGFQSFEVFRGVIEEALAERS